MCLKKSRKCRVRQWQVENGDRQVFRMHGPVAPVTERGWHSRHIQRHCSWSCLTASNQVTVCFLKQLKRARVRVPQNSFISTLQLSGQFWNTLIRSGITWLTAHRLSSWNLSTNGLSILYNFYNITRGMSYPNVLFVADLESLETRRNNLSRSVFRDVCKGQGRPTNADCENASYLPNWKAYELQNWYADEACAINWHCEL